VAKKQVIWSIKAQQDRVAILEYWIERNKSKTYSKKLFVLFNQAADLISEHPKIGMPTNYGNVRFKIVRDYLLFYEEMENRIEILLVWDSRQDPDKLDDLLKK
jgi:plasmid stabilization system protein ParE